MYLIIKRSLKLLPVLVLCIVFNVSQAQVNSGVQQKANKDFSIGKIEYIQSSVLNEERVVNVYLPDGYSPDSSRFYPVIYLLDGSANEDFLHITGLVQFLQMIESIPPCIVVGIANVDRKRDFTFPTAVEEDKIDFPTTGHSSKFIDFIERELQPYISEKYKVNDDRILIGQSLGGLLASEILLRKSYLFSHYIIVSPSLWWNNGSLITDASSIVKSNKLNCRKIIVSVGEEGDEMEVPANQFYQFLKESVPTGTDVEFLPMPEESHLSILHNCIYESIQKVFK